MDRTKALAIGVLTLWPIAYTWSVTAAVALHLFVAKGTAADFLIPFSLMMTLHLLTMLEIAGLLAFYIAHLFKSTSVPQERKALWAVVLFMGNVLAMPVYWYQHVWKDARHSSA